jgi:hypothetical protein
VAQAVSRRCLTAEARVRSEVGTCEICGVQSGTGTGFFFSEYFRFPLSVSFRRCSILICIYMLLLAGQTGEAWEPSKKQWPFSKRGTVVRKLLSLFFLSSNGQLLVKCLRSDRQSSGTCQEMREESLSSVSVVCDTLRSVLPCQTLSSPKIRNQNFD